MFKTLFIFCIKLILSDTIDTEHDMKLFVKKSNEVMKMTMNKMILLEILPINLTYGKKNQQIKIQCIYCFQLVKELRSKRIYIFKYIYKIPSKINTILICEKCLKILKSLKKYINESNSINNSLDFDQQECSSKKRKLNTNDISDNSFIYEFLSNEILHSIANIKYNRVFFKTKDYQIITLRKIFEINLILKTLDSYEHILIFDYINIKKFTMLNYFLNDRFDIEQGYFDLENEILINDNLYKNFKKKYKKKLNKLRTIQSNIINGNLLNLFESFGKKEHIWSNNVYSNLIMINEFSKRFDFNFKQLKFKRNYLNVFYYIHIFEKFSKSIKKKIQQKFSENRKKYNNYVFIIEQLFNDIETYTKSNKCIKYLYDEKQFEKTIIKYYKASKSCNRKHNIINIENNIVNF